MRPILLLSVLLLAASWVVAQDTPSQTGQMQGQTGQKTSKSAGAGSQTTVEGCLAGADGKYTLTDKEGKSYNLTGDTSKLAEHVGHEVKITGTESNSSAAGAGTGMGEGMTLEVSSLKHISKTCKNAGGGGGMSH
jgi:hypothetical protein